MRQRGGAEEDKVTAARRSNTLEMTKGKAHPRGQTGQFRWEQGRLKGVVIKGGAIWENKVWYDIIQLYPLRCGLKDMERLRLNSGLLSLRPVCFLQPRH